MLVHKAVRKLVAKNEEHTDHRYTILCGIPMGNNKAWIFWKKVTCPDCLKQAPKKFSKTIKFTKAEKEHIARLLLKECEGFVVGNDYNFATGSSPRGNKYWRIANLIVRLIQKQRRIEKDRP